MNYIIISFIHILLFYFLRKKDNFFLLVATTLTLITAYYFSKENYAYGLNIGLMSQLIMLLFTTIKLISVNYKKEEISHRYFYVFTFLIYLYLIFAIELKNSNTDIPSFLFLFIVISFSIFSLILIPSKNNIKKNNLNLFKVITVILSGGLLIVLKSIIKFKFINFILVLFLFTGNIFSKEKQRYNEIIDYMLYFQFLSFLSFSIPFFNNIDKFKVSIYFLNGLEIGMIMNSCILLQLILYDKKILSIICSILSCLVLFIYLIS